MHPCTCSVVMSSAGRQRNGLACSDAAVAGGGLGGGGDSVRALPQGVGEQHLLAAPGLVAGWAAPHSSQLVPVALPHRGAAGQAHLEV